jgi:hypothetical protein
MLWRHCVLYCTVSSFHSLSVREGCGTPLHGFLGCQAGIWKDLPYICMSQAAPPRHCLPSLRHGSYLAPLSSATGRGPTFILVMKNHVEDLLSTYNKKTCYIFCLTEYLVLCATHTPHGPLHCVYSHHQKCCLVTAPHAPYCQPSFPLCTSSVSSYHC